MAITLDLRARTRLSTAEVTEPEAFAYWREMICEIFVRLRAQPVVQDRFSGTIDHQAFGPVELSTVSAQAQHVERTPKLISAANEAYLLASIQVAGRGRVEQDGRLAELCPGEMAFYDSTRPYTLHFDAEFRQVVVQIPRELCGIERTQNATARTLGHQSSGAAVAAFFRTLAQSTDPEPSAAMIAQATALFGAAASVAGDLPLSEAGRDAAVQQRVHGFLYEHLGDPRLNADVVAQACQLSRRTLYRIVGPEGVCRTLRRLRMDRARQLLIAHPRRTVAAIAAACGFESESGFSRAFRRATGLTPNSYRVAFGTAGR